MRVAGIVEVYHAELRLYFVLVRETQQVVVSQHTQIRIFEIIEIQTISFLDELFDVIIDYGE